MESREKAKSPENKYKRISENKGSQKQNPENIKEIVRI